MDKKLEKANADLLKLTEKMAKADEKLQALLVNDEAELAKKDEAIAKEKAKVTDLKKKLTAATKTENAEEIKAAEDKLTAGNEALEKKKEAKKTYQDKVKTAKSDYAKMQKEQIALNAEIAKLSATPAEEAPKAVKTEAPKAVKAEAPKTSKAEAPKTAKTEAPKAAKTEAPKSEAPKAEKVVKASPKAKAETINVVKPRLQVYYEQTVRAELQKEFNYKNVNEIPKLEKIVLNTGLGDVKDNSKSIQVAINELAIISGQKPYTTIAKKSVANFKVREGMTVGAKVTLRGKKMYEFFDKFVSIVLPRVRDFKGVPTKSFDGRGNYAMGVKEQLIFPEISYDDVEKVRGFDICVVTTAKNDEQAKSLLKLLGMPFMAN